ncbi:MAG TPA: TAXI family TRAP transporter solute-binding subunit, partial [Kiloniellales bacterium]|nr:TAXI family TRAP transporter solute-binding subunit [Kiloniellales bacterium]
TLVYEQALVIGEALREATGTELTVEPRDSDLARAELLRSGAVDFAVTAVAGSLAAQEGVFDFAAKDWGPQKVRLVLASSGEPFNYAIAIAGDLGIDSYAGLKGKRVAWYSNYPVVNVNTEAYLAYGGLTWDDVQRVEIAGYFAEALQAMAEGKVDAAFAFARADGTNPPQAGSRGLVWPRLDSSDAAAMARMEAVAPYFVPHDAADDAPHDGAHYPYAFLVAAAETDADLVYNMAKALVVLFPRYQGEAFAIDGWHIDEQDLLWFVPYHEGAIAYFREHGVWTAAAQAHNDKLIARQEALAAAWEALKAEAPADWQGAWTERRRQALEAGGFQPLF